MLGKLKYEHLFLTSFSKMRVDLAAEVRMTLEACMVLSIIMYIMPITRFSVTQCRKHFTSKAKQIQVQKRQQCLWDSLISFSTALTFQIM